MSPGKVATLALECDEEEEDYRAYRSRYWEVNFEQYCGVSYSTGDEAGEGGPNVDISTVVAYSVDDCMDACAATNAARVAARLERRLGDRKVDVVLVDPSTTHQPVHTVARQEGVVL